MPCASRGVPSCSCQESATIHWLARIACVIHLCQARRPPGAILAAPLPHGAGYSECRLLLLTWQHFVIWCIQGDTCLSGRLVCKNAVLSVDLIRSTSCLIDEAACLLHTFRVLAHVLRGHYITQSACAFVWHHLPCRGTRGVTHVCMPYSTRCTTIAACTPCTMLARD